MIPIKDYIPSDEVCVLCNETNCDRWDVEGYKHGACDNK